MSLILLISILIRLVAMAWSVVLLARARDGRMAFLTVMLALMASRQFLTLMDRPDPVSVSGAGALTELPGLLVSIMAFLAVFFLERILAERHRLESQLRQSQKVEAVGRLAGGVAHDFNNFLTAIQGYSDSALPHAPTGSPVRRALGSIRRSCDRAGLVTSQLLSFSRSRVPRPDVHDLNILAGDMVKMLRPLIAENIEMRTALDETPLPVYIDPTQAQQVLLNLVLNARDAMPGGGKLDVRTEAVASRGSGQPDRCVLTVADNGHGMDESTRAHLFEPFFTTKPRGKGSGLGLATVHEIVRRCKGEIDVQTAPGGGTRFDISLPLRERVSPPAPAPATETVSLQGSESVLLVEDDAAVRHTVAENLTRLGYRVQSAANGEEALTGLREGGGPIDLLISDVVMPGLGGRRTADEVRRIQPDVRVLFLSGYSGETTTEESDPLLSKPFSAAALARRVRAVLDGDSTSPGTDVPTST